MYFLKYDNNGMIVLCKNAKSGIKKRSYRCIEILLKMSGNIQVYARVRPCFEPELDSPDMQVDELNENAIRINSESFAFNKVYWKETKQEKIFMEIAQPLIDHAIEGYNATLFAYGQTSSGKTYTLSGGDTYPERGIIPRSIQYIYSQIKKQPEWTYITRVSYIEIYNTTTYNLLTSANVMNASRTYKNLETIEMMESDSNIVLRVTESTLSPLHVCDDFESALAKLFLGETNRQIAETAANDVSSRSHCIFTMHIEGRNIQTGEVRKSKIHFVDLAGSESVSNLVDEDYKDRVTEAKFINLSLFYLHRVITALANKEDFIPYRSSRLTLLLKDSLGGNAMTCMIAALSSKRANLESTIQTCKFAMKVVTIKNAAKANISTDPRVLIEKLRAEIVRLRHELAVARGEEEDTPMTDEEREEIKKGITNYCQGRSDFPSIAPSRYQFAVDFIRENFASADSSKEVAKETGEQPERKSIQFTDDEMKKAVAALQRDNKKKENEIEVLVKIIRNKENKSNAWTQTKIGGESDVKREAAPSKPVDKNEMFRDFYKKHRKFRTIELNKKVMDEKIEEAQKQSQQGKKIRSEIEDLRRQLKETTDNSPDDADENEVQRLATEIKAKSAQYIDISNTLRNLKDEISTIEVIIKTSKKEVKKDFKDLWDSKFSQSEVQTTAPTAQVTQTAATGGNYPTTNDPSVDAKLEQLRKKKEEFMQKAENFRKSNSSSRSSRSRPANDQ